MLFTTGGMIKRIKKQKRKGCGNMETLKGVYHIPTP
jgi:hypothetical protein